MKTIIIGNFEITITLDPAFCKFVIMENIIINSRPDKEYFVTGRVKFDGCIDIDFHSHETRKHFCGIEEYRAMGDLLERVVGECQMYFDEEK